MSSSSSCSWLLLTAPHPSHAHATPLQAAIAHRQYILAHPVVRPALPEPAVEDRRRAAAAALYMSITTTEDAQEQPAAAGEDDYYGDLYDEDAYYDEVDMPQRPRTPDFLQTHWQVGYSHA